MPRSSIVLLIALLLLLFPTRILQEANPLWRAASYALALEAIAITLLLIGFRSGFGAVRRFAFPVGFFLIAVPWPTPLETFVIQTLTRFNTSVVTEFMNGLSIPAVAHGNVIELSTGHLGVEEACSGIRSTQAVLMLGLFFGEFYWLTARRRIGLVLAGFGTAVVFNVLRTSILVLIAARQGLAASNRWHDVTGISVLLACFVSVWAVAAWMFRKLGSLRDLSAPPGDSSRNPVSTAAPISAHPLRNAERPSTFALRLSTASMCVILFSALSVLGTELWFRSHEQDHGTTENWTLTLPTGASGFREVPLSQELHSKLAFDTGQSATWRNADGTLWQFFHFRWNPASRLTDRVRVQLAKSHRPDTCLPAHGWELQQEFPSTRLDIGGEPLVFRTFRFALKNRAAFVFFCAREDATGDQAGGNMRESHSARWRAAWQGNRGLGQRVLEIAISDARDLAEAEASLRRELPRLIQVSTASLRHPRLNPVTALSTSSGPERFR